MRAIRYVLLVPILIVSGVRCTEATPEGFFEDLTSTSFPTKLSTDSANANAGMPSSPNAFSNIPIWVHDVANYRYAVISGNQSCDDAATIYSGTPANPTSVTTSILLSPYSINSANRLCVIGQTTDGVWQEVSAATKYDWTSDTLSPLVTSFVVATGFTSPFSSDYIDYELTFNEAIDPASITAADFVSVGPGAAFTSIINLTLVNNVAVVSVLVQDSTDTTVEIQFNDNSVNDVAGNTYNNGNVTTVALIHDDIAPNPVITSPAAGSLVVTASVGISGTCESTGSTVSISGDITGGPVSLPCNVPGAGLFSGTITLTPALGTKNIVVSQTDVAGNLGQNNYSLVLTGPAALVAIPSSVSLGSVIIGQNATASFTVDNIGGMSATNLNTFGAGAFSVSSSTCGMTLLAGAQCTITVMFTPASVGLQSQDIAVSYDDGVSTQTLLVAADATGLSPAFLTSSPTSVSLGTVNLGQSNTTTFNIQNTGGVSATSLAAFGNGDFSVSGWTCSSTLAPAGTCSVTVMFTPTSIGVQSHNITVNFHDGVTSQSLVVSATGTGVNSPAFLTATPTSISFGNLAIGHNTTTMFVVDNTGGVSATSVNPSAVGAFSIAGSTCPTTLAAGSQCNITVRFTPVAPGFQSQNTIVAYNDGAAAQSLVVATTGTGVTNNTPEIASAACFYQQYYNEAINCTPTAVGLSDPGDIPSWNLQNSTCSFISIDPATGALTGTPATSDEGFCEYEVVVADGISSSAPWKIQHRISGVPSSGLGDVTLGVVHACGLYNEQPKCWGQNPSAANMPLGRPGFVNSDYHPVSVLLASGNQVFPSMKRLDAGQYFNCGISYSGSVYCWGTGTSGQLGGSNSSSAFATTGTSITNAVDIALGYTHACALRANGQVACWGDGANGKLGYNSVSSSITPVTVVDSGSNPIDNIIAISAGQNHTCALKANRQIFCWGINTAGGLGIDSTTQSLYATPAFTFGSSGGERAAMAISLGGNRSCAVLSNNTAFCWGDNTNGALGIETTGNRGTTPGHMLALPAIPVSTTVRSIAAGGTHVCAVTTTGGLKCWGANSAGQLGIGNTTSKGSTVSSVSTLADISLPTGATLLKAELGAQFTCAKVNISAQQRIYCFGLGSGLQLGVNNAGANVGDGGSQMGDNLLPVDFKGGLRLFVTSGVSINGNFGGLSGADTFCSGQAQTAGYSNYSSYIALLTKASGPSQTFYQRVSASLSPADDAAIYDSMNQLVAYSASDFANAPVGIFRPAAFNEIGGAVSTSSPIWTGTFNGSPDPGFTCNDWTSTAGLADVGSTSTTSTVLSDSAFGSGLSCGSGARFYCIGPEP